MDKRKVTAMPLLATSAATRTFPRLTTLDACDRCGHTKARASEDSGLASTRTYEQDTPAVAQAYVRVAKGERDLVFCSHHYAALELVLIQDGWALVTDQRADINPRAESGTAIDK
jgi:hypothetical protein